MNFIKAVAAYRTDDVSAAVEQDVLLMCGAEDHYVPVQQLADQVRLLTHVRSLTTRFSRQISSEVLMRVALASATEAEELTKSAPPLKTRIRAILPMEHIRTML